MAICDTCEAEYKASQGHRCPADETPDPSLVIYLANGTSAYAADIY